MIIPEDAVEVSNIVVSPSFEDPALESGLGMATLGKTDKKKDLTEDEEEDYKARIEGHQGAQTTVLEA